MSKRKYSIHKAPGYRLTDKEREILGTAWNNYIRRCRRISLRRFAKIHGVPYETWRREYSRGAVYKTIRNGNRWIYAEYDLEKARESIREGKANMGTKMKVTIGMAILFRHFVLKLRRSPYDARQSIVEAFPDRKVPCLKTFYNHIEAGDMGIHHGDTPYHPHRKRKPRTPAHDARTVPGRRQIKDRPAEANDAKELGHFEMDTIISRRGSHGGLLVLLDRCSRRYIIEHLNKGYKGIIIACTANSDPDDFKTYKKIGVTDIVVKPFKRDTIRELLEKWGSVLTVPNAKDIISLTFLENKSSEMWNLEDFMDTTGQNIEFAISLMDEYITQSKELMENLKEELKQSPLNYEKIELYTHTMKGSSASVSATRFADLGRKMNDAAKTRNLTDLESARINYEIDFITFTNIVANWKNSI